MDTLEPDRRGEVITRMNAGLASQGRAPLTPRQEHLVREFVDDDGEIKRAEDAALLNALLASNSA